MRGAHGYGYGMPAPGRRIWTPRDDAGCMLWLEASLGITLNAGKVSAWADQTGRGNGVAQGTAANQPVYNANPLNGRPTIQFDVSLAKYLSNTNRPDLAPAKLTMFAVARHTATQAINFLGGRGDTGSAGYWLWWASDRPGGNVGNGITSVRPSAASDDALNAWHVLALTYDGANGVIRRDGVAGSALAMTGDLAYAGSPDFIVGNTTGLSAARFFTGDLAELIVYDRAKSAVSRNHIEKYLGLKYGIAIA